MAESITDIVALIGSVVAVALALLSFRGKSRESIASTYDNLSSTVETLSSQLNNAIQRIRALEQNLLNERVISTQLKAENQELKAAYNKVAQKLARLETYVYERFGVRIDTDELTTPPPHDVIDWQDPPPIDSPPNE